MILSGIKPERAFVFFEQMCKIPHGSGNEKMLSDFLATFAKERGLEFVQDKALNILIKKPATPGKEGLETVVLQGHIDMVCEKNNRTVHDFEKDPISLIVDGDFIKAAGTTLGADNGAGCSMMMAILDADDIPHPPIEALFTTGEEVGMLGAEAFDCSRLTGRRFINLDSEGDDVFTVSCAGGARVQMAIQAEYTDAPAGLITHELRLGGLFGGHSGVDIHLERGNANRLLARALLKIDENIEMLIGAIEGGAQMNAIPREAWALVAVKQTDAARLNAIVAECDAIFKHEYQTSDPGVTLTLQKAEAGVVRVLTKDTARRALCAILLAPNGIQSMSLETKGIVECSSNVGVVKTDEKGVVIDHCVRSAVESRKALVIEQLKCVAALTGAAISQSGDYPGWAYRQHSHLREVAAAVFKAVNGHEPRISAIHAGLECGLFCGRIPDVDMISFGCNIAGAHTPEERLSISSYRRVWKLLLELLKSL